MFTREGTCSFIYLQGPECTHFPLYLTVYASSGILLYRLLYMGRSASLMCISLNLLNEEHVIIPIFGKRTVTQGDMEQAQGHS